METNYREGYTIMKKGKNKHNRKIWELVEKYFYGNIKEAINFFDKECKEMGANSKTYEAEYYSEDKKTNRKLIICDSRPPFDDEDNYIHVGIGNENEKQYEREYEKLYETVFIPENIPYLGEALNFNRGLIKYYIQKAEGQEELLEKNLLNLNNAIGKYIEEEKIFEDSETNKEPGIFEKFFGVFFGNKKVNKILSNIEKILSEYGIIDLETAQQVKELEVLQKEYDEYLPIEDDKLYLPQGQNKKEKILL